jgi:hypothetical protein
MYTQETTMRFIISTVGAQWEDRILRFYDTQRVVQTHSMAQARG